MNLITTYPQKFELDGEMIELHEKLLRKITREGKEQKCSFERKIVGYSFNEEVNEYVIIFKYDDGYYCMSKQNGWFGPFKDVKDVGFDKETKTAFINTEFPLVK